MGSDEGSAGTTTGVPDSFTLPAVGSGVGVIVRVGGDVGVDVSTDVALGEVVETSVMADGTTADPVRVGGVGIAVFSDRKPQPEKIIAIAKPTKDRNRLAKGGFITLLVEKKTTIRIISCWHPPIRHREKG